MACKYVKRLERKRVNARLMVEATISPETLEMFASLQGHMLHVPVRSGPAILTQAQRLEHAEWGDDGYQLGIPLEQIVRAEQSQEDCIFGLSRCPHNHREGGSCDGKNCLRVEMTDRERES